MSESAVAGWDQTSATCDDASAPSSIDLAPGEVVTCTFTNVQRGRIIIKKETLPDGSTQSFAFDVSWSATDASLQDGGSHDSGLLVPGLYSVTETPIAEWSITSATCDDESEPDAIGLSSGETVTCTFINQQAGRITIVKDAQPDGPTDFTFTDDIPGCDIGTLDDDIDGTLPRQKTCVVPEPGTFTVSEIDPGPGYSLGSLTCDDSDSTTIAPTATIVVGAGEHVTCTFVNVGVPQTGTIRIIKQTDPDGSTQPFTFNPSWSATDFILTDGQTHEAIGLAPGTHSVVEVVPLGWDLGGTVCSDGSPVSAIALAAGETVTCTFTNTQRGRIIVDKVTLPASDPQSFGFSLTGGPDSVNQAFALTDAATPRDSGFTLRAGTYTVAETVPTGWDLTGRNCSGDLDGTFTVSPGQTVTCTFTNTKRGRVIVRKLTQPASTQIFAFAASYDADGFTLSNGQQNDSGQLPPGTYAVSETVPPRWSLISATCNDGSSPGAIGVGAGETVTCTFTNGAVPLTIDKVQQNRRTMGPITGGSIAVELGDTIRYTITVRESGSWSCNQRHSQGPPPDECQVDVPRNVFPAGSQHPGLCAWIDPSGTIAKRHGRGGCEVRLRRLRHDRDR